MEKHRAYYELLDRLPQGGCSICHAVGVGMDSYLNSYLEEGVTDEDNWGALKAAHGWCGRHARRLEAKADGLAVSLFYGHLIDEALTQSLGAWSALGRLKDALSSTKAAPCPGCQRERESEAGHCHLMAQAAGEPEAQAPMRLHLQLCLPHFRESLRRAEGAGADFLRDDQGGKLKALRAELELFVRKTSHDGGVHEPLGPEADSWKRALKRWYGLHYPDGGEHGPR
jgi:hypothetical protein